MFSMLKVSPDFLCCTFDIIKIHNSDCCLQFMDPNENSCYVSICKIFASSRSKYVRKIVKIFPNIKYHLQPQI